MPEIPVFRNTNQISALPTPVLDRVNRQVIGNRAIVGAVSDAVRGSDFSQHLPSLGPEHFGAASAKGLQAVAQGVHAIGSVLNEIQQKKLEAQNYIDLAEAESHLDAAYAEFENWKMQPANIGNPASWQSKWDEISQGAIAKLRERPFSPMVRDRLDAETKRWLGKTSIRVASDATKATFERARLVSEARLESFVNTNNREAFTQELANYQNVTGAPDEVIQNMAFEANTRMNAKIREDLRATNPRGVEEMFRLPRDQWLPEYQGLSDAEVEEEKKRVIAALAQGKAAVLAAAKRDIEEGRLTSEAQWFREYQKRDPNGYLSYPELNKFGKMIGAVDNDPALFERFHGEIAGYDPALDSTGLKRAELEAQIDLQFTGSHAKELKAQLQQRTEKGGTDAFDGEFKASLEEVDAAMEAGQFGVWKVPVENIRWDAKTDSWVRARDPWEGSGDPIRIQISQEDARKITAKETKNGQYVIDLSARNAAAQRAAQIRRTLEEGRRSGVYKTPQEMRNAFRAMMSGTTISEAYRLLDEAEAPAVSLEGDLPSMQQGGRIDPALFDKIYQQTR